MIFDLIFFFKTNKVGSLRRILKFIDEHETPVIMDFSPKLKHKLVTEKKHLMALLINDNEASA